MNTKYTDEISKPAPARQYIILLQKPMTYIAEPCAIFHHSSQVLKSSVFKGGSEIAFLNESLFALSFIQGFPN